MKRLSLLLALALLGLLVVAPTVQAAPPSPFTGSWTSTDPGDGSTQYLTISGGSVAKITFIDLFGTICVNSDAPTTTYTSQLSGTVTGDTLLNANVFFARCGSVSFDSLVGEPATWTYDSGTDTLSDGLFVTWYRR